jgi:hypothetical protein
MTDREGLEGDKRAFGGKVSYPNDPFAWRLTYLNVGDGFDPSLGFVQRVGHVGEVGADYIHRPESFLEIREMAYGVSGFLALDPEREWESYVVSLKPLGWLFESGDEIEATIEPNGEHPLEEFDVFASPDQEVVIGPGEYRWTRYNLATILAEKRQISGDLLFSFGGFYEGTLRTIEANAKLKPASAVTLLLSGERNVAELPEGDFTQFLYSARIELKLSPEFQITNVAQYDNESRSLGSATRLRWTFHPQGDLFFAYDNNYNRAFEDPSGRRWDFQSDRFMIKVQYAVRL